MNVKIHRGKNQIGGNIIEISTDSTKIILDVGLELNGEQKQELPSIPELFEFPGCDAIFISHYHGDHVGLAYYINKDIPIYMGKAGYKILQVADRYNNRENISVKDFYESGKSIMVGDISVTPYLCDHSAFDSYMFLCKAQGETILYTGDFRANGRKSFASLLNKLPKKVDKLICEGTTLSRGNYISEKEDLLEKRAVELFSKTSGPVFVLQSSLNIDRIVTMYRAAKRSNRIFLEEVYMADVATAAGDNIPNPEFDDVFAFITTPNKYNELLKYENKMGKSTISKSKFVMCIRDSMLGYIKSLKEKMPFEDGVLVYSFWSGYRKTERMQHFLNECEKLGLKIVTLHTSGHADNGALKHLIKRINPTVVIPVHTENAKKFTEIAPNSIIEN